MEDKIKVDPSRVKEIIKEELIKCAQDPIYFIKRNVLIQHPTRGRMSFNLYQFQEKVLEIFRRENYIIINKSRQLGISTLVAGYALWLMIFRKDTNILVIATKQDTAKNLVTKVSFAYDFLPSWIKNFVGGTESNNRLSIRFGNGSQIKAVSAATDSGRSEAGSLLIFDECAFIDNIETIFTAAQQTLATGGRCIAVSTPNGTGNWFHREFTKAELGDNKFTPIRLPWTVHPERTQAWRDEQDVILGKRDAAQECDADFVSSGATVIEPEIITWYESKIEPPIERRLADQNYWLWDYPDLAKDYMIIVDVGRGDGEDPSAIQVIEIESLTQVAEVETYIDTRDLGRLALAIATEWNNGILVVENTGVGWDVVQTAVEHQYQSLYYSPKTEAAFTNIETYINKFDKGDGMVAGFTTSSKTRPLLISKFASYAHNKELILRSKRTVTQMRVFVWKNGKAAAQHGFHDDLIMALGIGCYLRDTALMFRKRGQDLTRASLDLVGTHNYGFQIQSSIQSAGTSPWEMTDGRGNVEDLTWLLR
jgi:hypothetical protein